ncbi:MAG: putative paraquat-inducible protein A [Bacillariaceae sp.]|jgi:uncharacterized paraquat-inducible protein A
MIVVTKNKEITYGMIQKAVVVIFLVIADYFDPRKVWKAKIQGTARKSVKAG